MSRQKLGNNDTFEYWSEKGMITYKAEIVLETVENGSPELLATWTRHSKIKEADRKIKPAKRFFRIGTTPVINDLIHFVLYGDINVFSRRAFCTKIVIYI